eukprot:8642263-Pyramimonas_sp.AAC.1
MEGPCSRRLCCQKRLSAMVRTSPLPSPLARRRRRSRCVSGSLKLTPGASEKNVGKGTQGAIRLNRLEILKQPFGDERFTILGSQEARNEKGMRVVGDNMCLAVPSGHCEFNLGREIWFNLRGPYAKQGEGAL